MDILSTCLRFSTSPGADYGLSKKFAAKLVTWVRNPRQMVKDFASSLGAAIKAAKDEVIKFITDDFEKQKTDAPEEDPNAPEDPEDKKEPTEKEKLEEEKTSMLKIVEDQLNVLINAIGGSLEKTVQKYEHEVRGIVAALSGAPSTPWHVTIGNPLRPVFCSGDMYTDTATLKLGSTLAFNDLPSNITLDFTLQNARPWGLQEIIAKFNTGHLRVVNTQKDFTSLNPDEVLNQNKYDYINNSSSGTSGTSGVSTSGSSGGGGVNGTVDNKVDPNSGSTTNTTKEGQDSKTINSDPNSNQAPVQGETKTEFIGTSGTSGLAGTSGTSGLAGTSGNSAATVVDPIGDANATSKRGYTYEIVSQGPQKYVIVKDRAGAVVLETKPASASVNTDAQFIKEAKGAVNDV
jgi:hypothetical protein